MLENLEKMIETCLQELSLAYQGKCNIDKAEKNAALFLEVQLMLADYVANAELKARMAKNEVERLSAEKYFMFKISLGSDKKVTEAMLENAIAKDSDVLKVKEEVAKNEADFKKWGYVMNTLKDGHIYYRTLSKNNAM